MKYVLIVTAAALYLMIFCRCVPLQRNWQISPYPGGRFPSVLSTARFLTWIIRSMYNPKLQPYCISSAQRIVSPRPHHFIGTQSLSENLPQNRHRPSLDPRPTTRCSENATSKKTCHRARPLLGRVLHHSHHRPLCLHCRQHR